MKPSISSVTKDGTVRYSLCGPLQWVWDRLHELHTKYPDAVALPADGIPPPDGFVRAVIVRSNNGN